VAGEGRLGEETNGNLSWGRSWFFKDRSTIGYRHRYISFPGLKHDRSVTLTSHLQSNAEVKNEQGLYLLSPRHLHGGSGTVLLFICNIYKGLCPSRLCTADYNLSLPSTRCKCGIFVCVCVHVRLIELLWNKWANFGKVGRFMKS
jgi:hypothetical protein